MPALSGLPWRASRPRCSTKQWSDIPQGMGDAVILLLHVPEVVGPGNWGWMHAVASRRINSTVEIHKTKKNQEVIPSHTGKNPDTTCLTPTSDIDAIRYATGRLC